MAWMWSIFNKVGPHTEDCISRAIRDRAEFFHDINGMSEFMARGKATAEVHKEVKEVYKRGGVEAVRQEFRCIPRENLTDW